MAKRKSAENTLPGLEDPGKAELPAAVGSAGEMLLQALAADEPAQAEALRRFIEAVFSQPDCVAQGAAFLARAFEGREAWLAGQLGTTELVQEMTAGQALLTCVAAGEWVARRDFARLVRLADGMLAARMHIKSPDCLDLMLAMASTLAVVKHQRATMLFQHVQECHKAGHRVDKELYAEARQRLQAGEVVCAADQTTREMWDLRLLNPAREWSWTEPRELQALNDLAEWLTPGHPAASQYVRIAPAAWRQQWQELNAVDEGRQPQPAPEHAGESAAPPEPPAAAWTGGMLDADARDDTGGQMMETSDHGLRLRLGWFLAGGVTTALVTVVLQGLSSKPPAQVPAAIPITAKPVIAASLGAPAAEAAQWCEEERERLAGELVHVGRLGAVKAAGWAENAGFLTGLTADLPRESLMYRKMLRLLHLDPPQDPETRAMVPRLLLRRAADEELIRLWERCVAADLEIRREISLAAREALSQPELTWSSEQRQRLQKLSAGEG